MTMQAHILRAAGAVANAGGLFPDYPAFLDYITGLANNTFTGSQDLSAGVGANSYSRVHTLNASGTMYGSSWGRSFYQASQFNRVIQHALPSQAIFDSQITNSGSVLMRTFPVPENTFLPFSRNGYTSVYLDDQVQGQIVNRLIYWDFSQGAPFELNPNEMTSPVPYEGE